MDERMAVGARPVKDKTGSRQLRRRVVPDRSVTFLAQPRRASLEQVGIGGPMCVVAVEAVLHDRGVLPQEGAALLRVALVTGPVDRGFHQQFWIRTSMRVVTIRAGDFALSHRHMRRALKLRPPHGMALEADFHLRAFDQEPVAGERLLEPGCCLGRSGLRVGVVTGHAGQPARFVSAPPPKQPLAMLVAAETGAFQHFRRHAGEAANQTAVSRLYMLEAGAMAGFAPLLVGFFKQAGGDPCMRCPLPGLVVIGMAAPACFWRHGRGNFGGNRRITVLFLPLQTYREQQDQPRLKTEPQHHRMFEHVPCGNARSVPVPRSKVIGLPESC